MASTTIQINQSGTFTLPTQLRSKYQLQAGGKLSVIDLDEFILLVPQVSIVSESAAEIEKLREEAGLSEDDLLEGLDNQRRQAYEEKYGPHR